MQKIRLQHGKKKRDASAAKKARIVGLSPEEKKAHNKAIREVRAIAKRGLEVAALALVAVPPASLQHENVDRHNCQC